MVKDEEQKIKQTILRQTSNISQQNFNENGKRRDKFQIIQHSMHWTDSLTTQTFCELKMKVNEDSSTSSAGWYS